MRIGLHIGSFSWPGSPANIAQKLTEIAQTVDSAGFYSLTLMDHLFQLGPQYGEVHGPFADPMLEGYTTLGYLAGITQRIKLGLLVTCNFFRPPGLLVKTVSTLDVLSRGRAMLGIGAGWFEEEALGLGIPLPVSWNERFARLEETLQIVHRMWLGDTRPFQGKYYQLAHPINSPQPLSLPRPPIIIGGGGEVKTLRLVAQYADACNLVVSSPFAGEEYGVQARKESTYAGWLENTRQVTHHKLEVLRQHCQALERPYEEIDRSITTYIKIGPSGVLPDEVIRVVRDLASLDFPYVGLVIPNCHEIDHLAALVQDLIPAVDHI
jgi:F420-dependent oxidoreductase-like protein